MRYYLHLTTIALICSLATANRQPVEKLPDPYEQYVTVLTSRNFEKAISESKYLVLDLYANWCPHCIELSPEFSKLGKLLTEKELKDYQITVAKIDLATEDEERIIGPKYKVQYYPTILFIIDGVPIAFEKQVYKSTSALYDWIKQILKAPPIKEITNESQLQEFISSNQYATVYFGIDNPSVDQRYWPFYQLAMTQEGNDFEVAFAFVKEDEDLIQKHAQRRGTIVGYKVGENNKPIAKKFNLEYTKDNLTRFYLQLTLSAIIPYDEKSEALLTSSSQIGLVLFVNNQEESQQAEEEFRKFALEHESEGTLIRISGLDWIKQLTLLKLINFEDGKQGQAIPLTIFAEAQLIRIEDQIQIQ